MPERNIIILGSTGSIGEAALRVVAEHPGLRVVALAARCHAERLVAQAREFGVRRVALADPAAAAKARALDPTLDVLQGEAGLCELAATPGADTALIALVGLAGLAPTLAAIRAGHDIALATKEVLVSAGQCVMEQRAAARVALLPVDSEHSAIFQCLQSPAYEPACVRGSTAALPPPHAVESRVARLLLTASGGPFHNSGADFETVTVAQTLNHPRWKMGPKITVDSATMMNKGLELIEARWLFNLPPGRLDVIVHPESIIHSLVEFTDGATLAQLSPPDMRVAIQYALTWPDRLPAGRQHLDLPALKSLTFAAPDETRFPCLALARAALAQGGLAPAVLNAANEIAVDAFLREKIPLAQIPRLIETALAHVPPGAPLLDAVTAADAETRAQTLSRIENPRSK